jgi:hypothetical protein
MARQAHYSGISIDARARGPAGPLAVHPLLGRPMVHHLLDAAETLGPESGPVAIHARHDEHDELRDALDGRQSPGVVLKTGPPPEGSLILRMDRLYDPKRLRRAALRGKPAELAAIWRLDGPHGLDGAETELARRQSYQPLGRYWALWPAKLLARSLVPTRIRPNALTLTACGLMLTAAGLVAFGRFDDWAGYGAAVALAVALVLDTADGHLARLQGTASAFGRWLDSVLDELADSMLHAGIAWSAFEATGQAVWLVLGMAYLAGKQLFHHANNEWDSIRTPAKAAPPAPLGAGEAPGPAARIIRGLGHADFRWHIWIALAALGWLQAELIMFSLYYPARAVAGAWSKRRAG